jgi:quercetin dioxygenase-like cupin family protein
MSRSIARLLLFAVLATVAAAAAAQDPAVVGPDVYKCIFDNEHTRVCEVTFKPGAKIGMHSHPAHFAYVMAPGKLRITNDKGVSQDVDFKVGTVTWLEPETHSGENIGTTEIKALVVEFRDLPAAAAAHQH